MSLCALILWFALAARPPFWVEAAVCYVSDEVHVLTNVDKSLLTCALGENSDVHVSSKESSPMAQYRLRRILFGPRQCLWDP